MPKKKETGKESEKPKPRSSLHRIGIVLAGMFGPFLLVLFLIFANGIGEAGIDMEKINSICSVVKGIIPILALAELVFGVVCYFASFSLKQENERLAKDFALGLLLGGIIGLIVAATAGFYLNTFSTGWSTGPLNVPDPKTTFIC